MGQSIIQLKHPGREFRAANGTVKALEDINLDINQEEIFGIIRLSGAGKGTLVRCVSYLEMPTAGEVVFEGVNLTSSSKKNSSGKPTAGRRARKELGLTGRKARQSMGMIFQQFNLLAQRNIIDNVCFSLEIAKVPRKEARARAEGLLKLMGLEERGKSYPAQLSGRQKQRVAIVRALAINPRVALCDEATSALDPNTTKSILGLLKGINRTMGITVIVITHKIAVIEAICDRVIIIDRSYTAEVGSVSDIFSEPESAIGHQLILGNAMEQVKFRESRQMRIISDGRESTGPVMSNLALTCKVPVNIIYAAIKGVDGTAVGQMVIQLPEDEADANRVMNYLKAMKVMYGETPRLPEQTWNREEMAEDDIWYDNNENAGNGSSGDALHDISVPRDYVSDRNSAGDCAGGDR